jgi:hypothetical protein
MDVPVWSADRTRVYYVSRLGLRFIPAVEADRAAVVFGVRRRWHNCLEPGRRRCHTDYGCPGLQLDKLGLRGDNHKNSQFWL